MAAAGWARQIGAGGHGALLLGVGGWVGGWGRVLVEELCKVCPRVVRSVSWVGILVVDVGRLWGEGRLVFYLDLFVLILLRWWSVRFWDPGWGTHGEWGEVSGVVERLVVIRGPSSVVEAQLLVKEQVNAPPSEWWYSRPSGETSEDGNGHLSFGMVACGLPAVSGKVRQQGGP